MHKIVVYIFFAKTMYKYPGKYRINGILNLDSFRFFSKQTFIIAIHHLV